MLDTYPRALDADAGMLAVAIDATTDCAQAASPTPTLTLASRR
jgi:hypothetical protein